MSLLIIGEPYIRREKGKSKLCSLLREDDNTYEMWFEVEQEYEKWLCTERIDAFVLAVLMYCLKHGVDIQSDGLMSRQLYYQLTSSYITTLGNHTEGFQPFHILVKTTDERLENAGGVGTGVSAGVDSFYTILKHYNLDSELDHYGLTHLTFFNAGSHGDFGGDDARELFKKRKELGRQVAEELKLPFLAIDSNLSEFIHMSFLPTASIRNLAMVLSVQKLFCKYYFSSGEPVHWFHVDVTENDNYDLLNTYVCSNENLIIHNAGMSATRLEKLKFISEFPITYKYLNICIQDDLNCGECDKCVRTMNALNALGKLDLYREVFDLEKYYGNIDVNLGKMLDRASDATYAQQNHKEAYELMKSKGRTIPKGAFSYVRRLKRRRFVNRCKNWFCIRILRR